MSDKNRILITKYGDEMVSILLGPDGKALQIERALNEYEPLAGSIYVGNVENIVPNIAGAFVNLGNDSQGNGIKGFLRIDEVKEPVFLNTTRVPGPIRQGDLILVQVKTEPLKTKQAKLTGNISIAGFASVITRGSGNITFSAKIKNEELKKEVRENFEKQSQLDGCLKDNDYIVRTSATNYLVNDILSEIKYLNLLWLDILKKAKEKKIGLIHPAEENYIRNIMNFSSDTDKYITDDKLIYAAMERKMASFPSEYAKLSLFEDRTISLGTVYNIQREISESLSTYVNLKSGGFLVIEPTEAMTVIDVNSGKSISHSTPEKERLELNIEAAYEIARQLRVRNLSGIIVIDFINLEEKASKDILAKKFEKLLANDKTQCRFVDMTGLGLVEITRKKVKPPLYEWLQIC